LLGRNREAASLRDRDEVPKVPEFHNEKTHACLVCSQTYGVFLPAARLTYVLFHDEIGAFPMVEAPRCVPPKP
jgi:hypothetical protein